MQEINRAAVLLGPKIQECNTRDKQERAAACRLDQTIGLLSSQTLRFPTRSRRVANGGVAVVRVDETVGAELHQKSCIPARNCSFHKGCARTGGRSTSVLCAQQPITDSGQAAAGGVFARDAHVVVGLLPMLQTLKRSAAEYRGTLMAKLAPIPTWCVIQFFGWFVQFTGPTRLLRSISHESNSASEMTAP